MSSLSNSLWVLLLGSLLGLELIGKEIGRAHV
jgi:hypothetical protein